MSHRSPVRLPAEPPLHQQVLEFEREAARGASKTIRELQRENAALQCAINRRSS